MAPITQQVVDLISLMGSIIGMTWMGLAVAAMLMRQLRWFGFDGISKDRRDE